ncbi:acyltransferase family protein [Actinomadura sp. 6N118]|uniref:acyltransferase family protein n=1 Tax=Actinomadura sp. 6N118 TaxID=3375151 RepID=UPI0037ACDF60
MTPAPHHAHPSQSPATATTPVTATPATAAHGRLHELDLLRFVAAAAVMLHHYVGEIVGWGPQGYDQMSGVSQATQYGNLGVDLFFLISGFVILMSAWGRGVDRFAVSRVVRLFPAYWFAVVLVLMVYLATGLRWLPADEERRGALEAFLPNMTMLQSGLHVQSLEGVYWTLWVELHFYVLVAVALLAKRGMTYGRCIAFMVAWLLAGVFAQEVDSTLLMALLVPTWAPYFVAGMAFYLMYRFGPNLALTLIIGFSWALATYHRTTVLNPVLALPETRNLAIPLGVTLVFAIMWLVSTRRMGWLGVRGATVLGALTYPLYLVHETLGRVVREQLGDALGSWETLGVSVVVALTVSYAVYRLVEVPAQGWLRPRLTTAFEQIRLQGAGVAAKASSPAPAASALTQAPGEVHAQAPVPAQTSSVSAQSSSAPAQTSTVPAQTSATAVQPGPSYGGRPYGEPVAGEAPLEGRWESVRTAPGDGMP